MTTLSKNVLEKLKDSGFECNRLNNVYTMVHKKAQEGFIVYNDKTIENFAFVDGSRVLGDASSEIIHDGMTWAYDDLFPKTDRQKNNAMVGPHAEIVDDVNTSVPAKIENKQVSSIGDIEQSAIDNHPGTIAALLMLQHTPDELVLARKGQGGKVLSYVDGSNMRKMANFAFLFNWSVKNVSIREDEFEFSAIVECTFTFTEGHTVTKTQVGSANKKYSKTLKNEDKTPRCIMIGDTIKSAITDGEKKCMAELGICQDVYSGEHKAKGVM